MYHRVARATLHTARRRAFFRVTIVICAPVCERKMTSQEPAEFHVRKASKAASEISDLIAAPQ